MAKLTADQVKDIVAHRPPGTTPEGIIAGLRESGHQLEGYDSTSTTVPQLATMPTPFQMLKNRAVAALPTLGGLAGGLIGGAAGLPEAGVGAFPMGVAGAALGGTIGKAAQGLITGNRSDPFLAGAGQGALEATGQLGGRLAGRIGRSFIPKIVTFQKAPIPPVPSMILDEYGKPFMVGGSEGPIVTFTKGATKSAGHAADLAIDVASHAMGPGGLLLRPAVKGLKGKLGSLGSPVGSFLTSTRFQHFARHFPRAAAALYQTVTYDPAPPDATASP